MATRLNKDVKRETMAVTDLKGNKMIVTLKAGDMLEFRGKGKDIVMKYLLVHVLISQ